VNEVAACSPVLTTTARHGIMFGQPPPRGLPWFFGIMYSTASTRAGSLTRRVSSTTTVRALTRLRRFSIPITLAVCQVSIPSDLSLGSAQQLSATIAVMVLPRVDLLDKSTVNESSPSGCSSGEASPAYAPT
jgi:hypothetical protein